MQTEPITSSPKNQRISTRVTGEHKALFEQAAALKGLSLTDFMVSAAYEAAVKTLADSHSSWNGPEDAPFSASWLPRPVKPRVLQAAVHQPQPPGTEPCPARNNLASAPWPT